MKMLWGLTFLIIAISANAALFELKPEHLPKNSLSDLNPSWHLSHFNQSQLMGISADKAYLEIPLRKQEVIIALIDGGVDINHEDLAGKFWVNPNEIPNNNLDDDNNGYVDDIVGWNFLGAPAGSIHYDVAGKQVFAHKQHDEFNLAYAPMEQTRRLRWLNQQSQLSAEQLIEQKSLAQFIEKKRSRALNLKNQYEREKAMFRSACELLGLKPEQARASDLSQIAIGHMPLAREFLEDFFEMGMSLSFLEQEIHRFKIQLEFHYNVRSNHRAELINENPSSLRDYGYGNNDVIGPRPLHGTHLAGVIAADRNNHLGIKGISDTAKLMVLRVVPDGDEVDKDVVNAIYYAVDNGAQIINMSFGKYLSSHPKQVWQAMQYAQSKGVLIVLAAGNDYLNLDEKPSFPNRIYESKELDNVIVVGASAEKLDQGLMANFSNYGFDQVDFLAPGKNVYSTIPNQGYQLMSGTSISAPIVSGVAAVLMAHDLADAKVIKNKILAGLVDLKEVQINLPSTGQTPLKNVLRYPGVINLFNSLKNPTL